MKNTKNDVQPGKFTGVLLVLSILFLSTGYFAGSALAFPGFLEGSIEEIVLNVDGEGIPTGGGTVRVNGVLATVPASTPISTPTARGLTLADISLAVGGDLPGRPTGFEGGTCLCATEVDATTGAVVVTDFVAEPAENGLIATVTEHNCSTPDCSADGDILKIGGTQIYINTDPRIPSPGPTNEGIAIDISGNVLDPSQNLLPIPADVEGYYADGSMYYYVLNILGGTPIFNAEIAVTRARCRDKNENSAQYRIQGTILNPPDGLGIINVVVRDGDVEVGQLGTVTSVPDPLNPGFGTWQIRETIDGVCVGDGTATLHDSVGEPVIATTDFGVDIR